MSGPRSPALLRTTSERASRFLETLPDRPVAPRPESVAQLDRLAGPLPKEGRAPDQVIAELDEIGGAATVASAGPRYFGFVIGSGLPVALAANWLSGAWNQNAGAGAMSPVATRLGAVALDWVRELLDLPVGVRGSFVTGATLANFAGLAAARYAVLRHAGWDLGARGLTGAPEIAVVVGEEIHVSALRALGLLGFGRERLTRVPVDDQGRMRADALPELRGPTIVCTQAGNVNSGAFDPFPAIIERARAAGAWVHVDGAFGLWAQAAPARRHLSQGVEAADSWSVDGHKWLNVPYDSGMVFVRHADELRAALATGPAAYLSDGGEAQPWEFSPEMSQRARGIDTWAAVRSLGRSGVADLVERCCRHAQRFAERLEAAGFRILNDVVLNQVLVSFGTDEQTRRTIDALQREGTCWCGGTVWHGTTAMRISVSSWATTKADVDRSVDAMIRLARDAEVRPPTRRDGRA